MISIEGSGYYKIKDDHTVKYTVGPHHILNTKGIYTKDNVLIFKYNKNMSVFYTNNRNTYFSYSIAPGVNLKSVCLLYQDLDQVCNQRDIIDNDGREGLFILIKNYIYKVFSYDELIEYSHRLVAKDTNTLVLET